MIILTFYFNQNRFFPSDVKSAQAQLFCADEDLAVQCNYVLDAASEVIDKIALHCRQLKYIKNLVLITNCREPLIDQEQELTSSVFPADKYLQSESDEDDEILAKTQWVQDSVEKLEPSKLVMDDIVQVCSKISANNINFKVIGIDLDDFERGYVEKSEKEIKKFNNELLLLKMNLVFNQDKVEGLGNIIIGNAEEAIMSLAYPRIKKFRVQKSYSAVLSLGLKALDNENEEDGIRNATVSNSGRSIAISVEVYSSVRKANPPRTVATTKRQNKGSYIAGELGTKELTEIQYSTEYYLLDNKSDVSQDPAPVENTPVFFDDENGMTASGYEKQEHLREYIEDGEKITEKMLSTNKKEFGYRLGNEVAMLGENEISLLSEISKGNYSNKLPSSFENTRLIELIGFIPNSKASRWMGMSPSDYIVSNKDEVESALALSSLVHSLYEYESFAIARSNATSGGTGTAGLKGGPEINLLIPYIEEEFEALVMVRLPFADDIRGLMFPPLGYLIKKPKTDNDAGSDDESTTITRKEKEEDIIIDEHDTLLPNQEIQEAMDQLVDDMDLMEKGAPIETEDGDDEERQEWGIPEEIKNPVLHRFKQIAKYYSINSMLREENKPLFEASRDLEVPDFIPSLLEHMTPPEEIKSKLESNSLANRLERLLEIKPRETKKRRRVDDDDEEDNKTNKVIQQAIDIDGLLEEVCDKPKEQDSETSKSMIKTEDSNSIKEEPKEIGLDIRIAKQEDIKFSSDLTSTVLVDETPKSLYESSKEQLDFITTSEISSKNVQSILDQFLERLEDVIEKVDNTSSLMATSGSVVEDVNEVVTFLEKQLGVLKSNTDVNDLLQNDSDMLQSIADVKEWINDTKDEVKKYLK